MDDWIDEGREGLSGWMSGCGVKNLLYDQIWKRIIETMDGWVDVVLKICFRVWCERIIERVDGWMSWRGVKRRKSAESKTVGWIDDGQMVRWMHELTKIEGQMWRRIEADDSWMDSWRDGWMSGLYSVDHTTILRLKVAAVLLIEEERQQKEVVSFHMASSGQPQLVALSQL